MLRHSRKPRLRSMTSSMKSRTEAINLSSQQPPQLESHPKEMEKKEQKTPSLRLSLKMKNNRKRLMQMLVMLSKRMPKINRMVNLSMK